ncbi:MAG: Bug family tripartite tricarboxylate transporter substrate binding protein [Burkholderiales bacterium]
MRVWTAIVLALVMPVTVYAQQASYPNRPVRVVVPFPPGGLNDVVVRVIAQKLGENLGQSVIIENRGGATGTIGSAAVAKAPADGYTLLSSGSTTAAVAPHLYSKLPYDQEKDLVAVGRIGAVSSIVLVHPSVPATTMGELIALMKAKPGTINFGSGGSGGSQHIGAELLKTLTGVQMTHVPYKGGGPAMIDLVAGQIAMMIEPMPTALPQIRAGKVKALAVTTPQRSSAVPDLPTVSEAGAPGYDLTIWLGFFAPAGTPREVIAKVNAELARVLRTPEMRDRLAQQGVDAIIDSPEEFGVYVNGELARWGRVVRDSGAKLD